MSSIGDHDAFPATESGCGMSYRMWLIGQISIATAANHPGLPPPHYDDAQYCLRYADAIIARLDKEITAANKEDAPNAD
jgi:hypothetical protein